MRGWKPCLSVTSQGQHRTQSDNRVVQVSESETESAHTTPQHTASSEQVLAERMPLAKRAKMRAAAAARADNVSCC